MAEPISKEELAALHTPEVIAQTQEALKANERDEGRRMTKEELEAIIQADRPNWMPENPYAANPFGLCHQCYELQIKDTARKLVEEIEKHLLKGGSYPIGTGLAPTDQPDFVFLDYKWFQQLKKKVLDG